ncbi:uncharacterized protein LOC131437069 isoform X2 [Malaya genurostris]|uniref:uncharacterized protein LOC131437069 isoform X2 n=1 Tax=Malaya genurostris TaxID=325434 RepID=UPI0026F3A442|nr:uncharacterized protein LOC131437069 isoform X2 [Malaya genurostris]
MSSTIPIYSIHNSSQLLAEPVHFPIAFGNEHFMVTQQDQRHILDQRTWYLSSAPVYPLSSIASQYAFPPAPGQLPLQQLLHQLVTILSMHQQGPCPPQGNNGPVPFNFHYEKQTSTDDLPYYMRRFGCDETKSGEPSVIRHFHYVLNAATQNKGVNTDGSESPGETGAGTAGFWNPWKRVQFFEENSVTRVPVSLTENADVQERMDCDDPGEATS